MRNILFIGGIHGVGKTTVCRDLSNIYSLTYLSASEIISKVRKEEFTKNKKIDNIDQNQSILIDALDQYTSEEGWVILDGHFCLLDKYGVIQRIPTCTFSDLLPKAIIIFIDDVKEISIRLKERDDNVLSVEYLHEFQKKEVNHAFYIAEKLSVPYLICNPNENLEELYKFVETCIK
ncbi:ATP-binding protein [Priestia aryabhattai]|uniref:ATP-binding protein n=1 Tax=Priestia aryabhattai TaxID=412384 RepID=UPI002E246C09|nr:ATP-binding protein [Priestia aryabhattai]